MKKALLVIFSLLIAFNGYSQCTANFTWAMAPVNNNLLRLSMTNTSTYSTLPSGKYVDYYMYWGDGNGSYVSSGTTTHDYASAGTYSAKLKMVIIDSFTLAVYCADSITKTITVAYTPCATSFSYTKTGLSISVSAANPAATPGMTYSWNWGDATAPGSGATATHTYASAGIRTITLTATNGSCTYTNTLTLSFTGTSCVGLAANFSFSVSGATASFSNTSTLSAGKVRTSKWYFGDGGTSTLINASHSYAAAGSYTVSLVNKWIDSFTLVVYCTDSIAKTVTVGAPPSNIIQGGIMQDSASTAPHISNPVYKVWLIKHDSLANTLTAVDSLIDSGTYYYYTPYQFYNEPSGSYLVKAQLLNGPTSGASYVPTYHISSLTWSSANSFYHAGGTTSGKSIDMIAGTATSGPGFIGGNISAGANKGTSAAGIEGMNVLLLNGLGKAVGYATTDVNGDYSFSNLAPASYTVYPEDAGFNTTAAALTILPNDPTYTSINFSRSMSKKSITPVTTGIKNVNAATEFVMYPNPATDKVTVNWNNTNNNVTITVTDITGKKVQQVTANNGKAEIMLNGQQKGLYFITLEANNVKTTKKLLLQ